MEYKCPGCGLTKGRDEVYLRRGGQVQSCKACQAARDRAYYAANPERRRKQKNAARRRGLLSAYGITQERYDELVATQEGRCPICDLERPLQVDHDHATGEVRFLLCGKCNRAEGLLDGDVERVERLARYLRACTLNDR